MLRIAKLEELQGLYDQPFSMDKSDEAFDDSSDDLFSISSGAPSPGEPEHFPVEEQDETVAASHSPPPNEASAENIDNRGGSSEVL
jgi:hypothetical protein